MFKMGEEIYAVIVEKFKNSKIVSIQKGKIADLFQRVEGGTLKRMYTVLSYYSTYLVPECDIYIDFAEAEKARKKAQEEINKDENNRINAQLDNLLGKEEVNKLSLRDGLKWLLKNKYIEVIGE